MSDVDSGLLAIEIGADDYADAAAQDTPAVSRTYQSEADFQAQKASYSAKIDGGNTYRDLITAVPILARNVDDEASQNGSPNAHSSVKLTKKDVQLLGYAVGALYYERQYASVLDLCQRVRTRCEFDEKTKESLERWTRRCQERIS